MRYFIFVGSLLLSSCASGKENNHSALMDRVERRVRLPEGSMPIGKYARYYAFDAQGNVTGRYITFVEPRTDANLPLGERRWVKDASNLPNVMDGGCSVVTVVFEAKTNKVDAWCNGVA